MSKPDKTKSPISKKFNFVLGAIILTVACIIGWKAAKLHSAGLAKGNAKSLVDLENARSATRDESWRAGGRTKAERELEYDLIFTEILRRNPGLEPEWKDLPDGENGFLQWNALINRLAKGMTDADGELIFSKELDIILSDEGEWDREEAAALMAKYADLLDEMTAIGLLENSSSAGIPPENRSSENSSINRSAVSFMLAGARCAAESGDTELAIARLKASSGISEHYNKIETSSFIDATVGVVCKLSTLTSSIENVLPNLELNQKEFSELRKSLRPDKLDLTIANMIRGEAVVAMRGLVIPAVEQGSLDGFKIDIQDSDAFYDAAAQYYLSAANQVEGLTNREILVHFSAEENDSPIEAPAHLSETSRYLYSMLDVSIEAYYSSLSRSYLRNSQFDAAFAILANEEAPLESITGKPYVFDEITQTLSQPDDPLLEGMNLEPIKLP